VMEEQVAEFRDIYPTVPMNANNFAMWQRNNHSFQSMAVMKEGSMPLGNGGHPLQVEVLSSTPGLFSVLSAAPELGRAFTVDEAELGHEHVVILMHNTWRDQFQSDRQILGKTITLNGFRYTVIGIMPQSFHLPSTQSFAAFGAGSTKPIAVIVPLAFSKEQLQETVGDFNYVGLAQLKPGISFAQANEEINALQRTIT